MCEALCHTPTPSTCYVTFSVCVCGHLSVPGPDRGGEGEGERLHPDPGRRAGELQGSGGAVEGAAGRHSAGAARHHAGVSVYKSKCLCNHVPHFDTYEVTSVTLFSQCKSRETLD